LNNFDNNYNIELAYKYKENDTNKNIIANINSGKYEIYTGKLNNIDN